MLFRAFLNPPPQMLIPNVLLPKSQFFWRTKIMEKEIIIEIVFWPNYFARISKIILGGPVK